MPTTQWCVICVRVWCLWLLVDLSAWLDTQWRGGTVCSRENSLVKRWAGYAEKRRNSACSREVEQLCVVMSIYLFYMLECNVADVRIDVGTNCNLMVNREGSGNNTMYGM